MVQSMYSVPNPHFFFINFSYIVYDVKKTYVEIFKLLEKNPVFWGCKHILYVQPTTPKPSPVPCPNGRDPRCLSRESLAVPRHAVPSPKSPRSPVTNGTAEPRLGRAALTAARQKSFRLWLERFRKTSWCKLEAIEVPSTLIIGIEG